MVLQLLEAELRRQLKLAEEHHQNFPDASTVIYYDGRVSVLRDLVESLEFYKNYTYEE